MKITTYLGDYADVTLSDVDQDGLAIEHLDEHIICRVRGLCNSRTSLLPLHNKLASIGKQ